MHVRATVWVLVAAALAGGGLILGTIGCGLHEGTSCLAAGTPVSTPRGDVAIEQLRVGDEVWSVDPESGERVAARIMAVRTARRFCLRMTTASGRRVVATPDHPFHAPHPRRFLKLATLAAHSAPVVSSYAAGLVADPIVSLEPIGARRRVYDLTLDGKLHTFLAGGVLVHNKSQPAPTIADLYAIRNDATGDVAVFEQDAVDTSGMATPVMLARDPFAGGVGIVHVTSATPFDALLIGADAGYGRLRLDLPMPLGAVDLHVTMDALLSMSRLTVVPLRAGVAGMPVDIAVPSDG